jgi:hypothetical protein
MAFRMAEEEALRIASAAEMPFKDVESVGGGGGFALPAL